MVTVQGKVQAAGRVSPALGAGGSGRRESFGTLGERLGARASLRFLGLFTDFVPLLVLVYVEGSAPHWPRRC